MPKADWGAKITCKACSAKFYDFGRSPAYCPQCGTIATMDHDDPSVVAEEDDVVEDDDDADVTLETDDDDGVDSGAQPEIEE